MTKQAETMRKLIESVQGVGNPFVEALEVDNEMGPAPVGPEGPADDYDFEEFDGGFEDNLIRVDWKASPEMVVSALNDALADFGVTIEVVESQGDGYAFSVRQL